MFFVSGAEEEPQHAKSGRQAQDTARCGGDGDAGGKDYDDVAKVGASDRGNFRPDDRTNKDTAQFGPSF
jgi:hypothetical protein